MFQNSLILATTITAFVMTVIRSIFNHDDIIDSLINILIAFGIEFVIFYIIGSGINIILA